MVLENKETEKLKAEVTLVLQIYDENKWISRLLQCKTFESDDFKEFFNDLEGIEKATLYRYAIRIDVHKGEHIIVFNGKTMSRVGGVNY